jgi:hypothetical protein
VKCVRLLAHAALQVGLDVGEEEHGGLASCGRELRVEVGEDVELRVQGVGDGHVLLVATRPEEGAPPDDALEIVRVDPSCAEDVELGVAEVLADDAHDVDVGEEARREGEVRCSSAEDPLAFAVRGLERVERDRADDRDGHGQTRSASRTARPAASRSAAALSVRSQVKSCSTRPKWP